MFFWFLILGVRLDMRDIVMICIYIMISWMRRTLFFINMNMIVVYYFKVYAELRYVITKLLPYVKRLYSATH